MVAGHGTPCRLKSLRLHERNFTPPSSNPWSAEGEDEERAEEGGALSISSAEAAAQMLTVGKRCIQYPMHVEGSAADAPTPAYPLAVCLDGPPRQQPAHHREQQQQQQ